MQAKSSTTVGPDETTFGLTLSGMTQAEVDLLWAVMIRLLATSQSHRDASSLAISLGGPIADALEDQISDSVFSSADVLTSQSRIILSVPTSPF